MEARTATWALTLLLPAVMLVAAGAGANHDESPVNDVCGATPHACSELDDQCASVLADQREAGNLGDHSDVDHYGYETEPFGPMVDCAALRDEAEWRAWDEVGGEPEKVQHCTYVYGVTCAAVAHEACDVAVMVATGLVYACYGGVFPSN